MSAITGIFPVHKNIFKIDTAGRGAQTPALAIIADMETFKLNIEGKVEEWYPLDQDGWARAASTGKKMSITLSGKRRYGDTGNDYVASMMMLTGTSCESAFEWTLPNGGKLAGNCVLNVTSVAGGDSTSLDALEVEIFVDGKPTYTPPAA